ncbi:MFS transporter, partial [Escherichia coli]|uniref:MFS transporter n=1 Tax=Escherichia coli TaxID=562 RepID=UPI00207C08B1
LFVGKTLLHGDVLMWLMKTLLTSGCTNQRGAGHLSSTIFLIGFQIASSLGIVLLSTPTGILFDHAGYQTVFFAISGIVCLMLLFGIFFLSKKREQIVMETPVPSAI